MTTSPQQPSYRPPTDLNFFEIIWQHPADKVLLAPPLHLMRVYDTGELCSHGAPYLEAVTLCDMPVLRVAAHEDMITADGPEPTCSGCLMVQRLPLPVLDDLWNALVGTE